MTVMGGVVALMVILGVASVAAAEGTRTGTGGEGASGEATAIREQIDTADEKVDAAVERVQAEATRARDALGRVGATARRAPSRD